MELEVGDNENSGEATLDVDDYINNAAFENERCGICTDIVIDRGVLDCCNHWFCFACIDNWATITNLCPLCKNDFQLITCLPVYDTLGNFKVDEHSISRDGDWCIQEKSNTLSFPSYYISEDAVKCLDGNGCKIRNGLSTAEEISILDTSIACDSCDMWYHAYCVGFDPDNTSGNLWLCPRCLTDEVPQRYDQRNSGHGHFLDSTFSGNVSISVADAGETAIVISMVEGKQPSEATVDIHSESIPEVNTGKETERSLEGSDVIETKADPNQSADDDLTPVPESRSSDNDMEIQDGSKLSFHLSSHTIPPYGDLQGNLLAVPLAKEMLSDSIIQPNDYVEETLSTSHILQDSSYFSLCNSSAPNNLKDRNTGEIIDESRDSNHHKVSSPPLLNASYTESRMSETKSPIDLHLDFQVGSSSGKKVASDATERNFEVIDKENNVSGFKKKRIQKSGLPLIDDAYKCDQTMKRARDSQWEKEIEPCSKKSRPHGSSQLTRSQLSTSDAIFPGHHRTEALSKDDKISNAPEKENMKSDIMTIVRGINHRSSKGLGCSSSMDKTKIGDNTSGIRVKKIMRVADNSESSVLIQKLKKEIRETVRENPSEGFGKNSAFDSKLLTAFRAAIARPRNEVVNKVHPSTARMKKTLLQKGKARENLTKKIYGTASGRRRRAWDRDWEIEFWKHRCLTSKPEKVETLQSVLDLLKRISSSENSEMEEEPEENSKSSILSRVYLADTSVFPRKEDIQPLSALAGSSTTSDPDKNKERKFTNSSEKNSLPAQGNQTAQNPKEMVLVHTRKETDFSRFKGEDLCRKKHTTGQKSGHPNSVSTLTSSQKSTKSTELPSHPVTEKIDKRKWALEVLARKNALTDRGPSHGKEKEDTLLKGSYPLLAQLPLDMRPVVAASHHNKVPLSVRQAQLYRLTEFYLKRADLPVIRRSADTELAVADAVNIEKEICEKSNSKLVYINLCAQHTVNCNFPTAERVTSHQTTVPAEGTKQVNGESCDKPSQVSMEEALKMTGLFSDSPPNSPSQSAESPHTEDALQVNSREEELGNVLDIDSNAELDIYGDFEYDLEDEGYIVSSMSRALRTSNLESEDGEKMKVILSTRNHEKLDQTPDFRNEPDKAVGGKEQTAGESDQLVSAEVPCDSPTVLCVKEKAMEDSSLKIRADCHGLGLNTSEKERYEEPLWAECEELYGPEKEPLEKTFSTKEMEVSTRNTLPGGSENKISKDGISAFEFQRERNVENNVVGGRLPIEKKEHFRGEISPHSASENVPMKEIREISNSNKLLDSRNPVLLKVEAYIKEHIRPLCKSGIITAEQYRWAVGKTTEKVMKYHCKAKNANFLIKEGDKVKKLAEQYVEASQQKEWKHTLGNKGNSQPST